MGAKGRTGGGATRSRLRRGDSDRGDAGELLRVFRALNKRPSSSSMPGAIGQLVRRLADLKIRIRPVEPAIAVEVDAVMAYEAVYQPGPREGSPLRPCEPCGAWALVCRRCDGIAECPGCERCCGHERGAPETRELQALRLARGIYKSASMTVAEALFRASNRAGLTRDESARMWARADAANGCAIRAVAMTEADGIRLFDRAIEGEKP